MTPIAATAATAAPPALRLDGVSHAHGPVLALDQVDLAVAPGSFVAVVGPSGCGKSTLLRLVAGLDRPTRGTIRIDTHDPAEVRAAKQVGWLAQRPALLPWSTVRDNVLLARDVVGTAPGTGPDVDDLLDLVALGDFATALPRQLSGGMQQRAALARMLAQDAPLWLMDEPLAALDELTREALATDLLAIWERLRPTVVWVTHHLAEAVTLADRVVVLGPRPGTVVGDLPVDLPRPRDVTAPAVQDVVRRARALLGPLGAATEPARATATGGHGVRP